MPLKLNIKRRLVSHSERVKSVELHPTEPWMLTSLYNGHAYIWNIETKQVIKTLDVSNLPVRVARFIPRKNWIVTGSDDALVRVFNYNTLENVVQFVSHMDFIRSIAVHPTLPYILTTGDDGTIRLWNWEKKWARIKEYRGHTYVVMQVVFNPKDNHQFATASLDKTVKVWQLGALTPNFSLKHDKDVNCLDYHPGNDKPYIVTGEDGGAVKIWDYQTKSCVQTLQVHTKDVNTVLFHPSLPIILSGGADGTVRMWHSSTYRLEKTFNFGMERVWMIACQRESNNVAIAFDEGCMAIGIGQQEPPMSMDQSGRILWAKHCEIQQANIKSMGDQPVKDGEVLALAIKDMGSCEIYPQAISHNSNGRFAVVCGDGEFIVYTAMALRSKCFGTAQEFVWADDSSTYAIREGNSTIKIFKNFVQHKSFKPAVTAEGIFGGHLLGVCSPNVLTFYDWDSLALVRKIEIIPKHIFWNDSGNLVCIATGESCFILRFNSEVLENSNLDPEKITEDGIEDVFEVLEEMSEIVITGLWVGDCFIYTSSIHRINYFIGRETITVAHLDRPMYILGYIAKDNRLYLGDKDRNIVSYSILLSVLEYQTAVIRRDFENADKILPTVPISQRSRLAHFLENQGFKAQALALTVDPDHKFDLALQLKDLKTAHAVAKESESVDKWRELSNLAMKQSDFRLAKECLQMSQDFGGLLLLASSSGNVADVASLARDADEAGKNNVGFVAHFVLGRYEDCLEILLKTNRIPEAALFARSYLPSQVTRVVTLWRQLMSKENKRIALAIADPTEYENLFPEFKTALSKESLRQTGKCKSTDATDIQTTLTPNRTSVKQNTTDTESHSTTEAENDITDFENVTKNVRSSSEDSEEEGGFIKIPVGAEKKIPVEACEAPEIEGKPSASGSFTLSELERELELDLENISLNDYDLNDIDLDIDLSE